MQTFTKTQFLQTQPKNGGDLWNSYKLCRLAFAKYPEAVSISYSIGTGLWVDLTYKTSQGETKSGQVYDSDDCRY
jgi:hypothetical protein